MTEYSGYEFLDIERRNRVLVATMNRPEKLNAVRRTDHDELTRLLQEVAHDGDTSVLVLRGAGRVFCIGGDFELVEQVSADPGLAISMQQEMRELVQAHIDLDKPIVAAVQGRASGVGAAFALLSDVIIAERGTMIGDCHTAIGVAAGDGGTLIWPLAMGMVRAKRYLLTGDWMPAEEAERLGLITEVVEPTTSTDRALEWADRLAGMSCAALQMTKRAVNGWYRLGMPAFEQSVAYEILTFLHPETAARLRDAARPPSKR